MGEIKPSNNTGKYSENLKFTFKPKFWNRVAQFIKLLHHHLRLYLQNGSLKYFKLGCNFEWPQEEKNTVIL